jgi:hypothetical protein
MTFVTFKNNKMTKDELIVSQQLQIEELSAKLKTNNALRKKLISSFYSIGAPLNDNLLNLNNEQLRWCAGLVALINEIETA